MNLFLVRPVQYLQFVLKVLGTLNIADEVLLPAPNIFDHNALGLFYGPSLRETSPELRNTRVDALETSRA
jgi:hypothetical protein